MRGRGLVTLVLAVLAGAFWLIQRAPYTVSAVNAAPPLIVIDPGHGGWDPGAVRGVVYEKSITLAVALKLGSALLAHGYRIFYTRRTDTALARTVLDDLNRRAQLANQLQAALFVSVHVNTEPTGTMRGPLVYYTRSRPASYRLALAVSHSLARTVGSAGPPRPIRQWVLEVSQMPAINVEIGFLSHGSDLRLMNASWYQSRLAAAIARGLAHYLAAPGR
ncbi:MAG: N-acetylmuramoyl-L-alanine amidase [Firmicutes bacterium]|nr:N-acetylmuramoyl-L-alanine amidase [Bacillota bacterium]